MPPRTRKATAPAQDPEEAAATPAEAEAESHAAPEQASPDVPVPEDGSESAVGEAANPVRDGQEPGEQIQQLPEGESATVSEPAASVPEGSIQAGEGAEGGGAPGVPDPDGQSASPVTDAPTFTWESVKGDGSAPCRLCNPSGPPPGAGSFGCSHGQWVRVPDAA